MKVQRFYSSTGSRRETEVGPFVAVIGKDYNVERWHWSVYSRPTDREGRHVLASGYGTTPDEAEAAALTWIRDTCTATLTALGDAS